MTRIGTTRRVLDESPPKQDTVYLLNGDMVAGLVSAMSESKIVLSSGSGPIEVPADSIDAIHFAATPAATSQSHGMRVKMDDQSLVTVSSVKSVEYKLSLQ